MCRQNVWTGDSPRRAQIHWYLQLQKSSSLVRMQTWHQRESDGSSDLEGMNIRAGDMDDVCSDSSSSSTVPSMGEPVVFPGDLEVNEQEVESLLKRL